MHGLRLHYRPEVCDGESWFGYLLRAANENGFGGISSLAALLGQTPERLFSTHPAETLARLSFPGSATGEVVAAGNRGYFKMRTRVCPECLRTDSTPFLRAAWDSPLVLVCHLHNIILTDQCPSCARPVKYSRPSLEKCRCGRMLESWPSRRAMPWVHEMYELMGCADLVSSSRVTFDTIRSQENEYAGALCRLSRETPSRAGEGRIPRFKFVGSKHLPALKRVFGDGVHSVFEHLASLQGRGVQREDAGVVPNTQVAAIWSQIQRDRAQARTLGRRPTPVGGVAGYVSKRFIMKATKLHPTAIDYLVASGLHRGVRINDRLPQFPNAVLVPDAEFQALLALLNRTMSIKEASHFAQTDVSTIRALGRAGALRTFRLGRAAYVFRVDVADLSRLINDLIRIGVRYRQAPEALLDLSVAINMCWKRAPSRLYQLIEDLRSRRLKVVVVRSNPIYLGDVFVLAAELHTWMDEGEGLCNVRDDPLSC